MKFALVDGKRIEALKGAKGICPGCRTELVAKCGEFKIHHWSHKGNRNCDPWWEPETEWHRSWKNNFPAEWQESHLIDEQRGERHIADIRTSDGFVIEFQHSFINPNERITREKFYKKMVWIVDGTRLKGDYPRFLKGRTDFRRTEHPRTFYVNFPEECFSSGWVNSSVPVIFDFKGTEPLDDPNDLKNQLYFLLPKKDNRPTILVTLSRQDFIDTTFAGELSSMHEK